MSIGALNGMAHERRELGLPSPSAPSPDALRNPAPIPSQREKDRPMIDLSANRRGAMKAGDITAEAYAGASSHSAPRPGLNAFITLEPDLSVKRRGADLLRSTGGALGPLHGFADPVRQCQPGDLRTTAAHG